MTAYLHSPNLPVQFHFADIGAAEAGLVTAQMVHQAKIMAVRADTTGSDRHVVNFALLIHAVVSESAAPDKPVVTIRGSAADQLALMSTVVIAD